MSRSDAISATRSPPGFFLKENWPRACPDALRNHHRRGAKGRQPRLSARSRSNPLSIRLSLSFGPALSRFRLRCVQVSSRAVFGPSLSRSVFLFVLPWSRRSAVFAFSSRPLVFGCEILVLSRARAVAFRPFLARSLFRSLSFFVTSLVPARPPRPAPKAQARRRSSDTRWKFFRSFSVPCATGRGR
jgi:hypothetical protein